MGEKRKIVEQHTEPLEHSMTWNLSDPGMDILERAGLAGLYMALRAAREVEQDLSPLMWRDGDLKSDSVTVRWTGPAKLAFVKLFEWAWQVKDGMLFLPAIHGERELANMHLRATTHTGIMRTFLQHVNTQPKLESITRLAQLDDNKSVTYYFEPPAMRVDDPEKGINPKTKKLHKKKIAADYVKPHEDLEKLFLKSGEFTTKPVSLSNWVHPGIAGRYGEEESWYGHARFAVLLMLAPTVCAFQKLQGEGGNWLFIVVDIRDLKEFDRKRRRVQINSDMVDVASLGDAGLRFLAEYSTRDLREKELHCGCKVVAMGYVGYYQGQSIRKSVMDVSPEPIPVRRYRLLHREMPNPYIPLNVKDDAKDAETKKPKRQSSKKTNHKPNPETPNATGFFKLPAARGRIADNLVNGRPWYTDLTVPQHWDQEEAERERKRTGFSVERAWFQAICYQRSKLMRLIAADDMWDSEAERVFVDAFWQTMDSLYGQEAEAVKRGGSRTVTDRFEDLNDEIRRRLMQAKTKTLLRDVLAELFAKAGRQKSIRQHPAAIWRFIDNPEQWRKGRDLALLALASHRKKEERDHTQTSTSQA